MIITKTRKGVSRHSKYILVILLVFFFGLSMIIIENFVADIDYVSNLVQSDGNIVKEVEPLVCNISHWRNGCRESTHTIYSNKAINLVELLYEELDTEEYLYNCTSYLTVNNTVMKACTVDTYIDKGRTEIWWSNITIGKHHTMCYFVLEKQLEDGVYVSNKNNIESFRVTAPEPKSIFSGYFEERDINDMDDYDSMLGFYRDVAPICRVYEYIK